MPEFELTWTGEIQETYLVEAETEEEAREKWSDTRPVSSESYGGKITDVRLADDDA